MKTVIAIIVLLLASITATVFSVREANVELPLGETHTTVTLTVTEKETATEFLSVTESKTETYEIETQTVAQTTESEAETTTQKPATTKSITTTTQRAIVTPTTQASVTTTKPVTATTPTTTQSSTVGYIDIDYYINFAIEYGESIGLVYVNDARDCWDTPIGVSDNNEYYVKRDVRDRLSRYRYHDGDEYFCVWAEKRSDDRYELFIGYA